MAGITEQERAIREERAQLWHRMEEIKSHVKDGDPRTIDAAERAEFVTLNETLAERDKDLELFMAYRRSEEAKDEGAASRGTSRDAEESRKEARSVAFRSFLKDGHGAGRSSAVRDVEDVQGAWRAAAEAGARFMDRNYGGPIEARTGAALSTTAGAGVDGDAGFLVPPEFWHNLQIRLKDYGGLFDFANILRTDNGAPMQWPTTDPTGQLGAYLSENVQVTGIDTISFGQGMMHAWFLTSGLILASYAIMDDSAFDVDNFVEERMGERIGRKIAAELWAGSGPASSALTGLTTALSSFDQTNGTAGSVDAAPKGGYYQPANSETAYWLAKGTTATATLANKIVSYTSLENMIATVDPAYRRADRCGWFMAESTLINIRSLTDAYARPYFFPEASTGNSDQPGANILGYPVHLDMNAPLVSSSGGTAGGPLFGSVKRAVNIRLVNGAVAAQYGDREIRSMRLTERYADYLQVGWIGYVRCDAVPNDLAAVVQYLSGAS